MFNEKKKEESLLSSMTKAHAPTEKSTKQRDNTKKNKKLRLHNCCGPMNYMGPIGHHKMFNELKWPDGHHNTFNE